jgi:hypothetical protein
MARVTWSVLLAIAMAVPAIGQQVWTEGTILGINRDNPNTPWVISLRGTGTERTSNVPRKSLPADTWHTIDFTNVHESMVNLNLPIDTKAVYLAGLLISSGHEGLLCGMTASFRAPGSKHSASNYMLQAVSAVAGGAFRQNVGIWVPVIDRKLEFSWHYPHAECSMTITLSLNAYLR